ncbi:protein kinase family protein [Arcanobacterium phocae]|uniref:hypothetical protein n=1 Tax=Arcanobacterium phocae TaxID=131112 RepID=UPI001C0EC30C|nr:hypothetical protein [Arcanobacterium phocae]
MSTSYAFAGQRIADRFELMYPASAHSDTPNASVWIARDTARSVQLRAIIIDPQFDGAEAVLDAARRTSVLHTTDDASATMVSTIAVVGRGGDYAIFTEIPPGRNLSSFLAGNSIDPDLVRSVIGEVSSAVNSARHHGIRHLALTADDVFITDDGNIVIDGYGIKAALHGIPMDLDTAELDRRDSNSIINLLAGTLTGKNVSRETTGEIDQDLVREAATLPNLPTEIETFLNGVTDGKSPNSPSGLLLQLVPWTDIDVQLLSSYAPSLPDPTSTDFSVLGTPESQGAFSDVSFPKVFNDGASVAVDVTDDADAADDDAPNTDIDTEAESNEPVVDEPVADELAIIGNDPAQTPEEAMQKVDELLGVNESTDVPVIEEWPTIGQLEAVADSESQDEPESENNTFLGNELESIDEAMPDREPISVVTAENNLDGVTTGVDSASDSQAISKTSVVTEKISVLSSSLRNTAARIRESVSKVAERKATRNESPDKSNSLNSSHFVIVFLIVVVAIAAIFGFAGLFRPLHDINLQDPQSKTLQTDSENAEDQKSDAVEKAQPKPEIESAELVDPDSSKYFSQEETPNFPDRVSQAIDSDPATSWESWYFNDPKMGNISGLGIHVSLKQETRVSQLTLAIAGTGGNVQIKTGNNPAEGELLYEGAVDETTTINFEQQPVTKDLLIWFTELPVDHKNTNRISLAEISVG